MSHNEMTPWWRCVRLIWRPDTIADAAMNVPLWMAGLFGGTAAGLLIGGFLTFLYTDLIEPYPDWQSIYITFKHTSVTHGTIPLVLILFVAFLPSLAVFRDDLWPGIQVILLSPVTIFPLGILWLVPFSLYNLQQNIVQPGYPIIELLDSSFFALMSSCFWFPAGIFLWATAIAWGFHRLKELAISGAPHCKSCRYDLRGTIPAGVTRRPECGEPIDEAMIQQHHNTSPA